MYPHNDYRYVDQRVAAILTTSYVVCPVIGKVPLDLATLPADLAYLSGPVGLLNQLILYVDFTIGSLTSAEIKIEFSNDGIDFYAETLDDPAASTGIVNERALIRTLLATGKYRIPVKVNDQYIRVSIKGTGTVTGSSAKVSAIIGNC